MQGHSIHLEENAIDSPFNKFPVLRHLCFWGQYQKGKSNSNLGSAYAIRSPLVIILFLQLYDDAPTNHPKPTRTNNPNVSMVCYRSTMGLKKKQNWIKVLDIVLVQSKLVYSHDLKHRVFVHMATNLG